jgi:hypothetical protein
MATPNYKELALKALGPALAGAPDIQYVQHIVGDLMAALAAPVTEVATFKLKEGVTVDALRGQIEILSSEFSAASVALAWGNCVEDPDTLVALVGWSSLDVLLPSHLSISTKM